MNQGSGGGGGGAGGYGNAFVPTRFNNATNTTGGTGGIGGAGANVSGAGMTGGTGGQGGGGGGGVLITNDNTVFYNTAAIQGGKGGLGGAGGTGSNYAANGQAGLSGSGGDGVDLVAGTLVNQAGGSISGGSAGRPGQAALAGVGVRGGSATTSNPFAAGGAATTVINYGRITSAVGEYSIGVDLRGAGSSLVNRGSGSITSASISPNATVGGGLPVAAFVNGSLQNLDNAMIVGSTGVSLNNLGQGGFIGGYAAFVDNGSLTNTSTIRGGEGGYGQGTSIGGKGGLGALLDLSTGTNSGTIAGGAGGSSYSGTGGQGGSGANFAGSYFRNSGTIGGGAGGASRYGGTGGVGGYGASLLTDTNSRAASTLYNSGTIRGGQGSGASAGGAGVYASFGGPSSTLINNGVIAGGTSGGNNPVQADAVLAGSIKIAIGTNGSFQGAIDVDYSATFDQSLQNTFSANASLSTNIIGRGSVTKLGSGVLTLSSGASTFSGGTTINAGTLDLNAAATITNGATTAGAAGTGAITFAGASGSLAILSLETAAQPASGGTFSNVLNNFDDYDELDLKNFAFDGKGQQTIPVAMNGNTGTITVQSGNMTESFTLTGTLSRIYYAQSDGNGGTLITDGVVCFAAGTLIHTTRGEVAVEDLRVGDLAVTASGTHRLIRWLGHREVDCRNHPRPWEVRPVRVAAHAFGDNRPARDLLVSPGHSLCVDVLGEVLIPAMALINGSTVRQDEVGAVTYWHVELDGHDVLLAENMGAESYLEMGNRGFFAEAAVVDLDAAPDAPVPTHADFCRPFHADGAVVAAVRAQLVARARQIGWRMAAPALHDVHLVVDGVRIDARVRDLDLCFPVPAGAERVWLVSGATKPHDVGDSPDQRQLGLAIARLVVDEGFSAPRVIAHDDERLCIGFHSAETSWRWTAGCAFLPAELWAGTGEAFFLRVELLFQPLPRWVAPSAAHVEAATPVTLVA